MRTAHASQSRQRPRVFTRLRNGSLRESLPLLYGAEGEVWHHAASAHRHPRHRHAELELNLALAGRAVYLVDDRLVDLPRNGLLWLFPGQDHTIAHQSADFRMWIVVFRSALVRRLVGADSILRARNPRSVDLCRGIASEATRELATACAALYAGQDLQLLNAGLGYLLLSAWRAFRSAPPGSSKARLDPAVARTVTLVRADPTRSGAELATAVGLSRAHLSRRFNEQVGTSLSAFRGRVRIERFLDLVERGGNSLLGAALAAGFGSYGQFYRIFRAATGQSPRRYLSNHGLEAERAK